MIGGYHSFVIETLSLSPNTKEEERMVRLHFIAHLVLSTSTYSNSKSDIADSTSIPSRDIPHLNIIQRTIMYSHTFYARILLDCAVWNLKKSS